MQTDNGALHFQATIDNAQLRVDAERSKQILHGIGQKAEAEGNAIEATMKRIGGAMAGVFAAGQLKDFAMKVATVRGEFQQLEIAFNTMLGSKQKADTLMRQLIKTAATTPFGMSEVAQSAKQLLAYGVEANKVNETLIRLGDIAAGLSIPMSDLAYLYGTTMVQGRMYTQDLYQFLNRGIPLTDELAKQFGVAKDKVRELVEQGKVGFPEVEKAIISLTSEGGKFGGLMAEQSKSITGQLSNLEDEIEQMFNEIGKSSEGVISESIEAVASLVSHWKTIGTVILTTTAAYGIYKGAMIAVNVVIAIHNRLLQEAALQKKLAAMQSIILSDAEAMAAAKTTLLSTAMHGLKAAVASNPLGLILTVVAAATTAFMIFKEKTDSVRMAQEKLNDIKEEAAKKASDEKTQIDLLVKAAKNEKLSLDERRSAVDKLNKIIPNYNAQLDETTGKYKASEKALKGYLTQLQRKYELEGAKEKIKEIGKKKAEARIKYQRGQTQADKLHPFSQDKEINGGTFRSLAYGTSMSAGMAINKRVETNKDKRLQFKRRVTEEYKTSIKELDTELKAIDDAYGEDLQRDAVNQTEQSKGGVTTKGETAKGGKGGHKGKDNIKEEIAKRKQEIQAYKNGIEQQNEEVELEIRQKEIDLKEESFDKQRLQIALNYNKLIHENKKRAKQMIDELKENKVKEWLNQHPKATEQEQIKYKASLQLTENNLTAKQKEQLKQYTELANDYKLKANRDALQQMLKESESYEQQRVALAEEYSRKIEQLYQHDSKRQRIKDNRGNDAFVKGAGQTNVEELEYKRDNALIALDEQFAQRENSYQAWCDEIANVSIEKLKDILDEAEEELKKLEKDKSKGAASEKQLALARAKAAKARQALEKANAKAKLNPGKRSIKEWQDLYKTLNECANSFKEIGNAVGGTVGKILSAAGQIATSTLSMINGIVTLVQMSSGAMIATAATASTAIQMVEKASVILTIISAALQVAMAIANMFNDDDSKEEQIKNLQNEIDNLQWELSHQDLVDVQQKKGKAVDLVNEKLKEARTEALESIKAIKGNIDAWGVYAIAVDKDGKIMRKGAEKIAKTYLDMGYAASKALGSAKYDQAKEQLKNIAQQQILLQRQIDAEGGKKKGDKGKIEEWKRKIEELRGQALEIVNKMVEDIIGGTSDEIADKLGDAFIEAFKKGEDAAKAWGGKVNDIVADILKRMLIQEYLQKPVAKVFEKYRKKWYTDDGKFKGFDVVRNSMNDFSNDLNEVGVGFKTLFNTMPEKAKAFFMPKDDEDKRETSRKGIATASQESIDELNGRITAIQGHTYSINETTKLIANNTRSIFASVLMIQQNTERLYAIENNMINLNHKIDDITLYGLKVK